MQPNGVNLCDFKLELFDLIYLLVSNIGGPRLHDEWIRKLGYVIIADLITQCVKSESLTVLNIFGLKGIYHGYTCEGRPETTKLSYLNAINFK